jgi:hypothetical protein
VPTRRVKSTRRVPTRREHVQGGLRPTGRVPDEEGPDEKILPDEE